MKFFAHSFLYTLEEADIKLMYDMCRYEQAWNVSVFFEEFLEKLIGQL